MGLLKAALLYADHVRLVSVGASTVATFDALGKMPAAKLELIRDLLPQMRPDASPQDLQNVYRIIDSMHQALRRGKRGSGLSEEERLLLRRLDHDLWDPIRNHVSRTLDEWGGRGLQGGAVPHLIARRLVAVDQDVPPPSQPTYNECRSTRRGAA